MYSTVCGCTERFVLCVEALKYVVQCVCGSIEICGAVCCVWKH